MVGFVGIALAALVLSDGLQNGNTWFSANQRVVLSVDGEDVNIEDYERRLQAINEQMQQRAGGQLTDEQRMNLNNGLAQELIAERILNKLAQEVGIAVTPDEVYALINSGQGVSPSPLAQQFFSSLGIDINDSKAVNDLIKQLSDDAIQAMPQANQAGMRMIQAQWRSLQENIRTSRLQQKIQTLLSRSYKLTSLDQELATAGGSRAVALVRTTPMAGSDKEAEISDAEIKKYYDEHGEFFRSNEPSSEISYISTQVAPSSEDYRAAEGEASKAFEELVAAEKAQVSDVVRNYNGSFQQVYLTGAELDQLGLGATEADFIKTAALGESKNFGLVNDKYTILRLVDKKQGISALGMQVIVLDSLMSTKTDSLLSALKSGASFEEMVTKYSQDPESKANGGRLSQPGMYGMPMDKFSEAQLAGSLFAEVYNKPVGEPFAVNNGAQKLIIKSTDAQSVVDKYQFAQININANFSDKTYNAKYDAINRILIAGGKFDDMAAKAEKEGFTVQRNQIVSTSSPQLGYIPSSRQLVSWALNAKQGEITDKVHRIGTDYLVIAQVGAQYEPGMMPLAQVREQIVARLSAEKRASNLAEKLSKKGLTSLDAYAAELNVNVDTLVGVNYFVRGGEGAAFNGQAMTTKIGQLSKPFVAGTEVMVVQPTAVEANNKSALDAQVKQQEQGISYQIANRVFQNLLNKTKIEDNRARFY